MNIYNPSEILQFTEYYDSTPHDASASGSWEDWDISGLVGTGEKLVFILVNDTQSALTIGVRQNGSSSNRYFSTSYALVLPVLTDSNGIIEVYSSTNIHLDAHVLGWLS